MFSSLFEKKWDGFHVRDRKGRIYVDLREEWIRPFIDHLKRNLDSDDYIKGATFFTLGSLQFFNFQRIFEVDFAAEDFRFLSGLEQSRILPTYILRSSINPFLTFCCDSAESAGRVDFRLISPLPTEQAMYASVTDHDLRYKSLLYVIDMTDGRILLLISRENQFFAKDTEVFVPCLQIRGDQVETILLQSSSAVRTTVHVLFPIKLFSTDYKPFVTIVSPIRHHHSSFQSIEIYEICPIYDRIYKVPTSNTL
jgi:hypothetical protein